MEFPHEQLLKVATSFLCVQLSNTIANFKNQFQPLILKVLEKKIYTQKECYSFLSLLCKQ